MSRLQAQLVAPPLLLHSSLWDVTVSRGEETGSKVRGKARGGIATLPTSLLSSSLQLFTVTPAAPYPLPPSTHTQSPGTTATKIETLIKASVKNIVNVRKYTNDNPLEVYDQLAGSN